MKKGLIVRVELCMRRVTLERDRAVLADGMVYVTHKFISETLIFCIIHVP